MRCLVKVLDLPMGRGLVKTPHPSKKNKKTIDIIKTICYNNYRNKERKEVKSYGYLS